jgi:hypothetical protein
MHGAAVRDDTVEQNRFCVFPSDSIGLEEQLDGQIEDLARIDVLATIDVLIERSSAFGENSRTASPAAHRLLFDSKRYLSCHSTRSRDTPR